MDIVVGLVCALVLGWLGLNFIKSAWIAAALAFIISAIIVWLLYSGLSTVVIVAALVGAIIGIKLPQGSKAKAPVKAEEKAQA